jgi:amidohydrolase
VLAASETVLALQSIVSRRIAASEPAVVSVCEIHGGTAYNIIPNEVKLTASVRSFGEATRRLIEREANHICQSVAAAHHCTADFVWESGYPSVVNDERMTDIALERIRSRFGADCIEHIGCIMPGEDYSYFLEGRPGFFVELGTKNAAKQTDRPHHNPNYRMDEDALKIGLQYEFDMVQWLLNGKKPWENDS